MTQRDRPGLTKAQRAMLQKIPANGWGLIETATQAERSAVPALLVKGLVYISGYHWRITTAGRRALGDA